MYPCVVGTGRERSHPRVSSHKDTDRTRSKPTFVTSLNLMISIKTLSPNTLGAEASMYEFRGYTNIRSIMESLGHGLHSWVQLCLEPALHMDFVVTEAIHSGPMWLGFL